MKKTLVFLLILSLSLSGSVSNKLDVYLRYIIMDLQHFIEATPSITFSSHVSKSTSRKSWTCATSGELLEELNVVLDKVNTDELSPNMTITLKTIKENLEEIKYLFDQDMKGNKQCRSSIKHSKPLECYFRILRCLYYHCTATLVQS